MNARPCVYATAARRVTNGAYLDAAIRRLYIAQGGAYGRSDSATGNALPMGDARGRDVRVGNCRLGVLQRADCCAVNSRRADCGVDE